MKSILTKPLKYITKSGLDRLQKYTGESEEVIDDVIGRVANYFGASIVENEELSYNRDYGKEESYKETEE